MITESTICNRRQLRAGFFKLFWLMYPRWPVEKQRRVPQMLDKGQGVEGRGCPSPSSRSRSRGGALAADRWAWGVSPACSSETRSAPAFLHCCRVTPRAFPSTPEVYVPLADNPWPRGRDHTPVRATSCSCWQQYAGKFHVGAWVQSGLVDSRPHA